MNWQLAAAIASPIVSVAGATLIAHVTARSTNAATKHQTESTTLVDFNQQLLEERQQLLGEIKNQVSNGHSTNLRDDLTAALRMVGDLGDDVRLVRADISGLSGDVRGLRAGLSALERRVAEGQKDT